MPTLHNLLLYLHVFCGSVALLVFWLPVLATKGSALHRRSGTWFANGMYAVSISALAMSSLVLLDPIGVRHPAGPPPDLDLGAAAASYRASATFLLMLAVLVFTSVRHSLLALRAKAARTTLRRPGHVALLVVLGVLGLGVVALGARYGHVLLLIFGTLSMVSSIGMLRYTLRAEVGPRGWLIEHLSGMVGAGIGAYTAFFAFGGSRFLSGLLPGQWQVLPWVLPAVIGTLAIRLLSRRYRRHGLRHPAAADQT